MNKHDDLRAVGITLCAIGAFSLAMSVISAYFNDSALILVFGVIGSLLLYVVGRASLLLIDIAKHIKVTAIIAIEQEKNESRKVKAKPSSKGKLGLRRIDPEKRKHA